jgi:hypothetical protein
MTGRIIRFSGATIIGCLVIAIVAGTAVRAQRLVGFDLVLCRCFVSR